MLDESLVFEARSVKEALVARTKPGEIDDIVPRVTADGKTDMTTLPYKLDVSRRRVKWLAPMEFGERPGAGGFVYDEMVRALTEPKFIDLAQAMFSLEYDSAPPDDARQIVDQTTIKLLRERRFEVKEELV